MRRRPAMLLALAATVASAGVPASAAAPVKPKNGLYQGATGQAEAVVFRVKGRDSIHEPFFRSSFGTCDGSTTTVGLGEGAPITNRGKFNIFVDFTFAGFAYRLKGKFVTRTKVRGRLIYEETEDRCGVPHEETRFRMKRTERL